MQGIVAASESGGGGYNPSVDGTVAHYFDCSALTGFVDDDPVGSDGNTYGAPAIASGGARPLYESGVINGEPALLFSAGNCLLRASLTGVTSYYAYVVCKQDANDNYNMALVLKNFGIEFRENGSASQAQVVFTGGDAISGGLLTSWALWEFYADVDTGDIELLRNGVSIGTANITPNTPNIVSIGARPDASLSFNGYIATVLLFDGQPAVPANPRGVLSTKYGF